MSPPPARRDVAVDVLHGIEVADPYRWLEDGEAPETRAWVEAQNRLTRAVLDARPDRPRWQARLVELLAAPVSRACHVAGGLVFSLDRRDGRAQHALVVRPAARIGPSRLLLDPALGADPTTAIDWYEPSPDGRLVALGLSQGGDERSVLHVLDVETAVDLGESIPDTRAASVAWRPDASGFLYTRYPPDSEYGRAVYEHDLGGPWADDPLVWDDRPSPEAWPDVRLSRDGRWVLVHVAVGWSRTDVHLLDRARGAWQVVVAGVEARSSLAVDGDRLLGVTTLDAPRGRVVVAALDAPGEWSTLVAEGDQVLDGVVHWADGFYALLTDGAVVRLRRHARDGADLGPVALPDLGSFAGFDVDEVDGTAFAQLESFTRPPALHRVTPDGLEAWDDRSSPVAPEAFRVVEETYRSGDDTEVGLLVVEPAEVPADQAAPTILTGYGGFAIASTPAWSPLAAAWCERGGRYAVAGLRGGSEHGEVWHEAGRGSNKQHVFDDFAAAADHLVTTGRATREGLALRGGSNGGLLVAAALTQRPTLARAVHCAVPLTDMVRFPEFLIARLWIPEYGDPGEAADLRWLYAYSPYHHVEPGTCYPAVLVTTADGDSRVDPAHARKFAAALQWASSCQADHPVLFHQERQAGHGVGKPLHLQADEAADVLSFLAGELGGPAA